VVTATPGTFRQGDYILFYGEGPVIWKQNPLTGRMEHATHPYSDVSGYFIVLDNVPGKRIPLADPVTSPANGTSNSYTATAVYEKEVYNLIKSGRKWFSDKFDNYTRNLQLPDFSFPDVIPNSQAVLGFGVAGRATMQMSFDILVNDELVNNTTISAWSGENDFARELASFESFTTGSSDKMRVKVRFNSPNSSALGWLDYISLSVRSNLRFRGGQMSFRDPLTVAEGKVTTFNVESVQSTIEIWDVTDHSYVHAIPSVYTGSAYEFRVNTDYLREFVMFDGSSFLKPEVAGKVDNQNLHAMGNYDLIIVTHPALQEQAERLASMHNAMGEITATVVPLNKIYNEFSSGVQDITAIRDFMKMLYDKGRNEGYPKYLLLFGNASYDFKDRI